MCSNITLIGSVLLYFGISVLINLGSTELCKECITPDPENRKGWCVPAKYCSVIGNILGKESILESQFQKFIRDSKCSSDDGAENYCCDYNDSKEFCNVSKIDVSQRNTDTELPIVFRETNYKPSTFDLDAHPNLKLLTDENCGLSGENDRIAHGEKTDIDEFPFMALLQYERNKKDVFQCGGTLINKNYVLTAAHCIKTDNDTHLFSVRLGEHDVSKEMDCQNYYGKQKCNDPVQDIPIAEIHIHNKFVPRTLLNDIALIRLKTPANTTVNNVRFVCLPTTADLRERNVTIGNVAGWGFTENGSQSDILLKGSVDVNKERKKCIDTYQNVYYININEKILCAIGSQGKTDTCKGDSGGPLLHRPQIPGESNERLVQYGIVSGGPRADCGVKVNTIGGAIYVNIPTYMRWILDKIRE